MSYSEVVPNEEGASPRERVSVDTKLEKGQMVGFDMGEIQVRLARMQELEKTIVPDQSKLLVGLKRELETLNKEYVSLKEDVDMGIVAFADLQRFESVQGEMQSKQAEVAAAELARAESRRELAVLNPEAYGDLYQMERAQAESYKSALTKAVTAMDANMIDKIKGQIDGKGETN